MKTILLPFYDDQISLSALDQACLVARRFDSHIEGLFVLRPPQIIEAEGIALAGAYLNQLEEEWRRRADSARTHFENLMQERKFRMCDVDTTGDGPSASWRELEGPEGQVIGEHGRLFDLIVIGRTSEETLVDWQVMCEAAFFESGGSVLLTSSKVPEHIGKVALIHWNCSTEAARSVGFAKPWLRESARTVVLTIEGNTVSGPAGDAFAAHLRRSGVPAEAVTTPASDRQPGEVLLDYAKEINADLLVKGAYTHNRLRQLVFGGVTRYVLQSADIPVLMAR